MNLQDLKDNIGKFSFAQLTSNSDGKSSMSGTMGGYLCTVGGICFALGAIDFAKGTGKNDIMMYSSGVIAIGAGLLGWRKSKQKGTMADEATKLSNISQ